MRDNILSVKDSISLAKKLNLEGKTIVLVGGVFDILHIGHLRFLINAKRQGDIFFVLLENDKKVRKLKGKKRPVNSQKDRAELLSNLKPVDYIVLLPRMKFDKSYDKLIDQLKPKVLAITKGDPGKKHKIRQGKMVNAIVKEVIGRLKSKSTTNLTNMLKGNE